MARRVGVPVLVALAVAVGLVSGARCGEVSDLEVSDLYLALYSRTPKEQETAAKALAKLGKRGLDKFVLVLNDDERRTSQYTVLSWMAKTGPASLPYFRRIAETDRKLAHHAATFAYRIDRGKSAETVFVALTKGIPACRSKMAELLITLGPDAAKLMPRLITFCRRPGLDPKKRLTSPRRACSEAILAGSWGMQDRAVAASNAAAALKILPQYPAVCGRAFKLLARCGEHAAKGIPNVLHNLSQKGQYTTKECCYEFLEELGPRAAPGAYKLAQLAVPKGDVRSYYLISRMGPKVAPVIMRLKSMRLRSRVSGRLLSFDSHLNYLRDWHKYDQVVAKPGRWIELRRVGDRGTALKRLAPGVKKLFKHKDPLIRCEAARTYWKITGDAKTALPVFRALLKTSNDGKIHYRVAEAIAQVGPAASSSIPELLARMGWKVVGIDRVPAARGRGTDVWVTSSSDPRFREVAMWALLKMGPEAKKALPALRKIESEGDRYLSGLARWAIRAIDK
jgi:hypothetical protein